MQIHNEILLGEFPLGLGHPCRIIAEIGVNHDGDLDKARQLVWEAKKAGADCAKFQTFTAEEVVTAQAPKATYQLRSTARNESQFAMLKKLELSREDFRELKAYCEKLGIVFLSTPYSQSDVALLNGLGVSCFKVASALLPEPALLRAIAATGKPMLLSTGMATLAEVDEAVSVVKKANNDQVILLHCTTDYPALVEEANLLAMVTMGNAFGLPVGYSDHTATGTACIAAVALGACVIERHFTLDREQPGPDHACSDDPAQFAILVRRIRECELALGDGRKNPGPNECRNARGMRRGLVTRKDIRPGETLDEDVLTSKRPAVGLSPRDFDQVVGLRARVAITADQPLYWWMLDKPEN